MTLKEATDSFYFYEMHKCAPGSFIRAVLENDLYEAINRADLDSLKNLADITRYVYNNVPSGICGCKENVKKHLESKQNL